MTVGVLVIGGPLRDADGIQREQRGRRVDPGVHGLGQDAEAAGDETDEQLDADEGQRRAEREERGAPGHRHRGIVLAPFAVATLTGVSATVTIRPADARGRRGPRALFAAQREHLAPWDPRREPGFYTRAGSARA